MSIKKKLAMGALSGALALSLIGAGTLAAFNDVEEINNRFATGTLDLEVVELGEVNGQTVHGSFDLSNLKPGESMTRAFELKNVGTLAIQHVLLHFDEAAIAASYQGQEGTTWADFLKQFQVEILRVDKGTGEGDVTEHPPFYIVKPEWGVTLYDLVTANYPQAFLDHMGQYLVESDFYPGGKKLINLAPIKGDRGDPHADYNGLPVNPYDTDVVIITITFKDDTTRLADLGGNVESMAIQTMAFGGSGNKGGKGGGNNGGGKGGGNNGGGDNGGGGNVPSDPPGDGNGDNGGYTGGNLAHDLLYDQNKYQNASINVPFVLEATQWDGIHSTENGYIDEENKRAHPQSQPNPFE